MIKFIIDLYKDIKEVNKLKRQFMKKYFNKLPKYHQVYGRQYDWKVNVVKQVYLYCTKTGKSLKYKYITTCVSKRFNCYYNIIDGKIYEYQSKIREEVKHGKE